MSRVYCALPIGTTLLYASAACTRPAPPQQPSQVAAQRVTMVPIALTDTAVVLRLCIAPDSVLAGRRACVLRDQRPMPKIF
jgi:hypothetical protein